MSIHRVIGDTFNVTAARLASEFVSFPPLKFWLDPDANALTAFHAYCCGLGDLTAAASGPANNFLDPDWRALVAAALELNTNADRALQLVIDQVIAMPASRRREELLELAHYAQPVPDPFLLSLPEPQPRMQWCAYLLPALLTMKVTHETTLDELNAHALDATELQSPKFTALRPISRTPPILMATAPSGDPALGTILLEGRFRARCAQEKGLPTWPAYEVTWNDLAPYVHQQPTPGWHNWKSKG